MEQVFSTNMVSTWDRRHASKSRIVRLWLSMLGMAPTADKTNGIIIILFRCYSCLISSPDICIVFLSLSLVDCGLKGWLYQWSFCKIPVECVVVI